MAVYRGRRGRRDPPVTAKIANGSCIGLDPGRVGKATVLMPSYDLGSPGATTQAARTDVSGRVLTRMAELEEPLLRRIASTEPRRRRLVLVVTALGSRPAAYTVTLGCATLLATRGQQREGVRSMVTLVTGDLVRELACHRIGRDRPPAELRHAGFTGASFPSRHATLAALSAGAVIGASTPGRRRVVAATATAGCAAVAASRLRLGVHWPSDVAAGLLFAAAWRVLTGLPAQAHRDQDGGVS